MLLIVFVCVLAAAQAQNLNTSLTVNITQGSITGGSAIDGNYYAFYGIHYGGSTSGVNRFKAPTPPPVYPGTFHAVDSTVICAQPSQRGLVGAEDCLTLNIFTNNVTTSKPVLVFLNGEEYTTTSNILYSFKHLVEQGVVVVSINYRLSIFGFLCLGVPEAPGNAGLKDVTQGLKWINENIAAFGGNPSNVVLFGHGSAAAMADLITMSPLSRNLVHKVIVQSGSALAPWAIAYDPFGYARALGVKLGYTGKTRQQLAQLLVNTDITVLAAALNEFEYYNNTPLFAPCIEDPSVSLNETFLSQAPLTMLRAGNYSQIPYMTGYVTREGSLRAEEAAFRQWLEKMQANFTQFLPVDLDLGTNATTVEKTIREFYFGQRIINMETIEDYLDYHGDTLVLVSVIRGARERALTSSAAVRLYEFGYRGTQNSDWPFQQIPLTGVKHGGVLNFLFDIDLLPTAMGARDSLIQRFIAFINTGSPEPPSNPQRAWEPITSSALNYLRYSGGEGSAGITPLVNEEARINPHQQRMTLWNDIYFKYYKLPRQTSSASKVLSFTMFVLVGQFFTLLF